MRVQTANQGDKGILVNNNNDNEKCHENGISTNSNNHVKFASPEIGELKYNIEESSSELQQKQQEENEQKNAGAIKLLSLKLLTLVTIISFLWSGLVINFLQLINYLTLRNINFSLFIKINYYLMYSAWAQIITLFDWFFSSKFKVYHSKLEQQDEIFHEHNIFLANHGYELDWIGAWLVTDKFGHSASCKAMLKSDLKYLPIVGWSWAMSDQLFLDRNWERDKHKFGSSMDQLLRYEPMIATFFCEGTRFTKDKVKESQQFARERGIQAPKYHLIPRTKGFVAVMRHIKQRKRENSNLNISIYNAQIAFEQEGALSIGDIIGKALRPRGHLYFEKISIDSVPDDDEACAQWLHDLYLSKDKLQEYFNEHKCFPGYQDRRFLNYKPRLASLFNWLLWATYTAIPLALLVNNLYSRYGTLYVSIVMSIFFLLSYIYLNYIMYQADVSNDEKTVIVKEKEKEKKNKKNN